MVIWNKAKAFYCDNHVTILTEMSGHLTQLLCLVYVLWTKEDQLLHGLEGPTRCRAGEVVEPWAALSMASNGCTQPFAVFAKLQPANSKFVKARVYYSLSFNIMQSRAMTSILTRCVPEITALSTFSSSSSPVCFTPSDHTAHQWWTQHPPVQYGHQHQ